MSGRPSRVVFVGNIPYDLTETQLIDIFKEVGPVVSFRLVFDRDTGKPKGYGFCTFQDSETAASAVRNLNNYDVGGRQLRIDFAESDKEDNGPGGPPPPRQQQMDDRRPPMGQQQPMHAPAQLVPPIQQHAPPPAQSSVEDINKTLAAYPPEQMLEVLAQMKVHIQSNPNDVRAMLAEQPQLSYALFQALLVMNVVDPAIMQVCPACEAQSHRDRDREGLLTYRKPTIAQRMLQNQVGAQQMAAPFMQGGIPPHMAQQQQQQQPQFQRQQSPHLGAPPVNLPPANQQMMTPEMLQEQQKQLLLQVLNMTPEQIQLLPPDQREKIHQLRSQILGQ
ncbi:Cleavage stimulation factor subunit 2 [Geranomyces variabilis]|nr:Cleavage stimulation factor subunit 2 [Geranomyces variabilis]